MLRSLRTGAGPPKFFEESEVIGQVEADAAKKSDGGCRVQGRVVDLDGKDG